MYIRFLNLVPTHVGLRWLEKGARTSGNKFG